MCYFCYLFSQYFAVQYMLNFKEKFMEDLCLWCKKNVYLFYNFVWSWL